MITNSRKMSGLSCSPGNLPHKVFKYLDGKRNSRGCLLVKSVGELESREEIFVRLTGFSVIHCFGLKFVKKVEVSERECVGVVLFWRDSVIRYNYDFGK